MGYKTWVTVCTTKLNGKTMRFQDVALDLKVLPTPKIINKILKRLCGRRVKYDGFIWVGGVKVI